MSKADPPDPYKKLIFQEIFEIYKMDIGARPLRYAYPVRSSLYSGSAFLGASFFDTALKEVSKFTAFSSVLTRPPVKRQSDSLLHL